MAHSRIDIQILGSIRTTTVYSKGICILVLARVMVRKECSKHGTAAAKPLRPTLAIPASPPDFVSMLRSLSGTDTPVTGEDDEKGIRDDEGIVTVVRGGRETGACGGGTDPGLGYARSIEGQMKVTTRKQGLDVDQDDWEELNDEQLFTAMSEMDNKLQDPDWVPEHLRKRADLCAKLKAA
ncbi:hypothetical protein AZE42_04421 [Rhizopogon vesiculosus]|uniref:Uncharacterized protein n=1 Tax=Rhizopogon vesiculosus TaxID=180088 RepID=A0A1J8PE89_9AGAM|nr:hypothetical protein AZE42_04421 [Rhizopogon vesiculosus]